LITLPLIIAAYAAAALRFYYATIFRHDDTSRLRLFPDYAMIMSPLRVIRAALFCYVDTPPAAIIHGAEVKVAMLTLLYARIRQRATTISAVITATDTHQSRMPTSREHERRVAHAFTHANAP